MDVDVAVAVSVVPAATVTGILGDAQPSALRIIILCVPADTPLNTLPACGAPPSKE